MTPPKSPSDAQLDALLKEVRSRPAPAAPRRIGLVNWRGLWTLYAKEVMRFVKVGGQTVLAPVVTSLLFLAIFTLALGREVSMAGVTLSTF